ncbi:hypothetical protein D9M71_496380 [compost metagenome]
MELEQVRFDPLLILQEIVVAHRHTPADWQRKLASHFGLLAQVTVEQEVALSHRAPGFTSQKVTESIRCQPLAGAGNSQHVLTKGLPCCNGARGNHTLAQVLPIE